MQKIDDNENGSSGELSEFKGGKMNKQLILMKRLCYIAFTVMIVTSLGVIGIASADWNIQPISINGSNDIHIGSMALDANGNPHIFSTGYDSINSAYYSKWNGANWENLELISNSPCFGADSNIELDSHDNPRILFYNDCWGGPVYGINYAERINNLWPITRLDTRFWTGKNNDLKLDANDNPHIIYTAIDGYLRYGKRIGGTWTITNIEKSGFADSIYQVGMALDSSGNPHAVYASVATGYLRYAKWDGSNWLFQNIEYLGNTPYWYYVFPSIVIDANGNPHLSYWNSGEKKIKYAKWDGTNWNIQIVGSGDTGRNSMAMNSKGDINIAYSDNSIKFASLSPSENTWKTEIIDNIGTYSYTIRMAIDKNDLPHVIYDLPIQSISKYAKKNYAPIVNAGPDQAVFEGDTVSFSGSFMDADTLDTHTISWEFGDGSNATGTLTPTHVYADNGAYTVTLTITDNNGGVGTDTLTVTVNNVAPIVTITGPVAGSVYAVNNPVSFTGTYFDPSTVDTHTAQWSFDSIYTPEPPQSVSGGSVITDYTFTSTGVYQVKLTVTDDDGGAGIASTVDGEDAYVMIYDPNGGFVTGGGWINSPGSACPDLCGGAAGKANFGFVSKYKKGATIPTGETKFQFKAGNLNFQITAYDGLVVSGPKAQYKGTGTINGAGDYGFLLTAIDGQKPGGGGSDKFRIKIVDKATDEIVYDNVPSDADYLDTANLQVIGGGSIVIHK